MAMSCWLNRPSPESENDVTYFEPLSQQTVMALEQFPTHLTADAAFDARSPVFTFQHTRGSLALRFQCLRVQLDRSGPLYQAVYTQRTSCERINSQAKELGIERPKVRNRRSVAHLNTLIYVVINVRTLDRAKSINRGLLQMS
jgi:hypothetical protein